MHRRYATPGGKVVAAFVAVALSGVVRPTPADASPAPSAQHQCRCGSHGPGHSCCCRGRAKAGEARATRRSPPSGEASGGPARAPCLTGSCGTPEAPRFTAQGPPDSFLLPRQPLLALAEWSSAVPSLESPLLDMARCPEPRPPRAD